MGDKLRAECTIVALCEERVRDNGYLTPDLSRADWTMYVMGTNDCATGNGGGGGMGYSSMFDHSDGHGNGRTYYKNDRYWWYRGY
jgi:hypothetical protein